MFIKNLLMCLIIVTMVAFPTRVFASVSQTGSEELIQEEQDCEVTIHSVASILVDSELQIRENNDVEAAFDAANVANLLTISCMDECTQLSTVNSMLRELSVNQDSDEFLSSIMAAQSLVSICTGYTSQRCTSGLLEYITEGLWSDPSASFDFRCDGTVVIFQDGDYASSIPYRFGNRQIIIGYGENALILEDVSISGNVMNFDINGDAYQLTQDSLEPILPSQLTTSDAETAIQYAWSGNFRQAEPYFCVQGHDDLENGFSALLFIFILDGMVNIDDITCSRRGNIMTCTTEFSNRARNRFQESTIQFEIISVNNEEVMCDAIGL